jgi:hypothetical protein
MGAQTKRQASIYALFGGQGTNEVYFDELQPFYDIYRPFFRPSSPPLHRHKKGLQTAKANESSNFTLQERTLPRGSQIPPSALPRPISPLCRFHSRLLASCSGPYPGRDALAHCRHDWPFSGYHRDIRVYHIRIVHFQCGESL